VKPRSIDAVALVLGAHERLVGARETTPDLTDLTIAQRLGMQLARAVSSQTGWGS